MVLSYNKQESSRMYEQATPAWLLFAPLAFSLNVMAWVFPRLKSGLPISFVSDASSMPYYGSIYPVLRW